MFPLNSRPVFSRIKILSARDGGTGAATSADETKIFSWQQKVYGKFERQFYRDEKNCVTDLDKRYHEDVVGLPENDDVLFSYVKEDEFCLNEENCVVNSKTTTQLCKQVSSMRLGNDKTEQRREPDGFNFKQSLISSLNNPYGDNYNFEVMHIMADLGEYVDDTWLKSEYILCTIKYDHAQRLLLIFPDFTHLEPYYVAVDGDTRRTFHYSVEEASEKMPVDWILKENEILSKVASHQAKLRLQKTGTDFQLPPKSKLSVLLLFEILTARNFEYNDIYVQYFIDLPENWFCKEPSSLKGSTQTSHSRASDSLTYFGFPFEVSLEYSIQEIGKSSMPRAPYVYFEVISKDSWTRFRTEGLTYTILPISQPGAYSYDLQCLRICPKGPSGNLRRFFIGDCSGYADITWTSVPKDHDGRVVNKFGVDTVSTGQISVRVNVVHQSQAFMVNSRDGAVRRREKFLLEKLSLSGLANSIQQVLEAFKAAKQRMIEARKDV